MKRCVKLSAIVLPMLIGLTLLSCSKDNGTSPPPPPSTAVLIAEGWQAYASHDYTTARARFNSALQQNANLADAYNGLGWVTIKQNNLIDAVADFSSGLAKDSNNLGISAGLSIVYNAQKNYSLSIQCAASVLARDSAWVFVRDPVVNANVLRLILAEDYFARAEFAASLQYVRELDVTFDADVSTTDGQSALAGEIEQLRQTLAV